MIKYDFKFNPWQVVEGNFPFKGNAEQQLYFLLRYAILAPSSHNTQPWKFAVDEDRVRVFANLDRWLRVADGDRREMYISIGCAIENLLVAAAHFGIAHATEYFPDPENERLVVAIRFFPGWQTSNLRGRELFEAISTRHTNHKEFESRPIARSKLDRIQACSTGDGISVLLTSGLDIRRKADGLINRADAVQFADSRFREELGYWIGQGVFGTPWLLAKLSQLAAAYLDLGQVAAKKDSDLLMGAPVLGLICTEQNDRETHVKVGQVFERIYLTVTSLGLALQPMSQLVEVAETKAELAKLMAGEAFPQQPFRLGYAEPEDKHIPRRPFEEVFA